MEFTWTETHTANISDERLKEIWEDGKDYPFGGASGLIADVIEVIIGEAEYYNPHTYVDNWNEIYSQIYNHMEEIVKNEMS